MDQEFVQQVRQWASKHIELNYSVEQWLFTPKAEIQEKKRKDSLEGITNTSGFVAIEVEASKSDAVSPSVDSVSAGPSTTGTTSGNIIHFDRGVELPLRAPQVYFETEKEAAVGTGEEDAENAVVPLMSADPWDDDRLLEAEQRIRDQGNNVSDFWRNSYRDKAAQYWHAFYKRNTDNFYKDRHYLHVEFPELLQYSEDNSDSTRRLQMLEVGCGVGNAVTPLLELNSRLYANAIDFAKSAIDILRQHPCVTRHPGRLIANTCNVITDALPLPAEVQGQLDVVLCMFVLSAIVPEQQLGVLKKLAADMKCGARLCIRDYGRYDEAQLRFKKGSKIQANLYVRADGTMAYYFELNELVKSCGNAGFVPVDGRCGYVRVQQTNRNQGKTRHRVFVQAVFEKVATGDV